MNEHLARVPDGSGRNSVVWFSIRTDSGVGADCGEIYWPFALHMTDALLSPEGWSVTHLLSGYRVRGPLRKATARRLINKLRATKADWTFTEVDEASARWKRHKATVGPIVRRYHTLKHEQASRT